METDWSWDLGADGVVRLVVDERGVETVYRDGRIVARSPAGGSPAGHTVLLPPRVSGTGEAFRENNVPSRELRLRHERSGWRAQLEGVDVPPASIPDPMAFMSARAPIASADTRSSNRSLGVIIGLVAAVIVLGIAFVPTWRWAKGALARASLTHASHEVTLKKQWLSPDANVTVMSPSDFETLPPSQGGVLIERKGNAEAFAALMVPNPSTTDLDAIMKVAVEGGTRTLPANVEAVGMGAVTDGDCNGEPGRITQGQLVAKDVNVTLKMWICVSLRPGLATGLRRPAVQLFMFTVPEILIARDEPVLRDMIKHTELKDVNGAASTYDPFGPSKFDAFSRRR